MSDQLFREKYTERQLITSPAVTDFQVEPSYPELTDREVMKTKASEWYTQADTLISPEVDTEHHNKVKAMGPVPVDAYGFPVDRHGDRLPDQFRGMNQSERMQTITSMSGAELADRTRQHALDHDQSTNKANLRDTVIKGMLGDRMIKDPLSGMWRGKTETEVLFEMGKGRAPDQDYGITKAEQDLMNPVTWAGVQMMAGGIDALQNFARLTEEASLTMQDGPYKAGRAAALADPKRETTSLYGPIGKAISVESDGSVSGALIRGFSQFLIPYTGALKAMSGVSKGLTFTKAAVTGAAVDFSTIQASDGNLSDLLLSFGVESEALRYMSANDSATQFDARIRTAVDGFFFGEAIGMFFKGGVWTIKKTASKIKQKQSANMIMGAVRAARGLNRAQVDHVESQSTEVIANHLMEEADRQADLPPQAEAPAAPATEDGKPASQPKTPEPDPYAPSQEVKTAYAEYALSKLLKEDLTPEEWMKDMKGKGHPELLRQAYTWAKSYMAGDNGEMGKPAKDDEPILQLVPGVTAPAKATFNEKQIAQIFEPDRWHSRGLKVDKKTKIYRGVSEKTGRKTANFGKGLYTTTDLAEAKQYGDVVEMDSADLPQNPLRFQDEGKFREWEQYVAREILNIRFTEFEAKHGLPDEWIRQIDPTIDGIQIGTGHGAFFVKFPETKARSGDK